MAGQTKIQNLTINDGTNYIMIWLIHVFVLIMFSAKIFKINDLSWWIVFSPYVAALVIYILTAILAIFKKKPKTNWASELQK